MCEILFRPNDIEIPDDFWEFVEKHQTDDVGKLRLKFHAKGPAWIDDAITHIECMKKSRKKLGRLQPKLMLSPLSVEQSTSEWVATLHGVIAKRIVGHPLRVLDMTCGMGTDLRVLSEALGCKATGIDLNPEVAATTAYNLKEEDDIEILCADSVEWLKNYEGERFDLIFIDPARRGERGERVYNIHHCQPDVASMLPLLHEKSRFVMIKLSPMLDVTQTLRDLPPTTELHVIDEEGECREMLCVLDMGKSDDVPPIVIVHSGDSEMAFTLGEERAHKPHFGPGRAGEWMFEPSPAAMKAKPFGILCANYQLEKLHPDTHLFISAMPVVGLPGKWYEIAEVYDFSSSTLKNIAKNIGSADVSVRNFPMKAEELQKRMKLKSGPRLRIMGATVKMPDNRDARKIFFLRKQE